MTSRAERDNTANCITSILEHSRMIKGVISCISQCYFSLANDTVPANFRTVLVTVLRSSVNNTILTRYLIRSTDLLASLRCKSFYFCDLCNISHYFFCNSVFMLYVMHLTLWPVQTTVIVLIVNNISHFLMNVRVHADFRYCNVICSLFISTWQHTITGWC